MGAPKDPPAHGPRARTEPREREPREREPAEPREVSEPPPFDGTPGWKVTRTLKDGATITIRGIQPEDRDELVRGFHAASAQTRYLRFLGGAFELSEAALSYLTNVDQKDHVALVATLTSADLKTERGLGVARFIRLGNSSTAEAAITVADDMQRRGVGSALAHELVAAAGARGIRTIRADVLEGNAAMRAILEGAGAQRVPARDADGTLSYDIAIEPVHSLPSRIVDLLRGAAQTMAVSLRKLAPPEGGHE